MREIPPPIGMLHNRRVFSFLSVNMVIVGIVALFGFNTVLMPLALPWWLHLPVIIGGAGASMVLTTPINGVSAVERWIAMITITVQRRWMLDTISPSPPFPAPPTSAEATALVALQRLVRSRHETTTSAT